MSYKVLYRKYRPDSFDSVVGQDYTVKMLKNASFYHVFLDIFLSSGKISGMPLLVCWHSELISGYLMPNA